MGGGGSHADLDDPDGMCPHKEAVARAYGLRDDLADNENEDGGDKQAHGARGEVGDEDGDGRVDDGVAQQQCAARCSAARILFNCAISQRTTPMDRKH